MSRPLPLRDCLVSLPVYQVAGPTDRPVTGIADNSRQVEPGCIFVAVRGYRTDGHAYIPQALARGAAVVVVDLRFIEGAAEMRRQYLGEDAPGEAATFLAVPNSRAALAPLAAAWYGFPARHLVVIGVTGTKGKTTTTTLISHVLERGGHRTGLMSTVDVKVGLHQWPNTLRQSTLEAPQIQSLLREMVAAHCTHAVLEASSHGLSTGWNRVGHCGFDVAVATNVTHEHLDYHGSLEQYRRDKARLFALLGEELPAPAPSSFPPPLPPTVPAPKWAIVNGDDPHHQMFLDAAPHTAHRLTYALNAAADVRGKVLDSSLAGSRVRVATPWGESLLTLRLPGRFNVQNGLAALSVALSQGMDLEQATTALGEVRGIRGRMEPIDQGQPFGVLVDYAHNPDSFTQVMGMLRPLTSGRMIAVFGSAGERDREKRPQQGIVAAQFCDLLVLTDEDPRGEEREAILADIAAGAEQAGKRPGTGYLVIPDRAAAIRAAFEQARPGDLVLLLGKGHEGNMVYADGPRPWNEAAEACAALRAMGYGDDDHDTRQ
ncbi:MAG: UDP-N-acetylmuramoyl-L-alanyl-D-glutamate--2,6-diaminopimelate ligase [Chloroflexaceae bacterium]|nr:UDP-N-acetylmuramoyl-L-alanyl-D-glutamate--2,6-diaminopimelate ligase [Chloroflexaceae bacterium]